MSQNPKYKKKKMQLAGPTKRRGTQSVDERQAPSPADLNDFASDIAQWTDLALKGIWRHSTLYMLWGIPTKAKCVEALGNILNRCRTSIVADSNDGRERLRFIIILFLAGLPS